MNPRPTVPILLLFSTLAFAGLAHAGGINLAWDDCGAFGSLQKNFACNTNAGVNQLYISAVSPVPMPQLNGVFAVIGLVTNQPVLSDWWAFQSGGCRAGAISADANFVLGPSNCLDPWGGAALGGMSYAAGNQAPNRAQIKAVFAIPTWVTSDGVSEYELARITITNAKTTGTGACAGCTDGVCLVLQMVTLSQPTGLLSYTITNPLLNQYAIWQPGGSTPYNPYGSSGCPGATPTRNTTWGGVKAIYR